MNRRQKEVINKHIDNEKQVMNDLKNVYEQALKDVKEKIAVFMVDPDMQSKIYQAKYQEQLKLQLESALDKLKSGQYDTLQSYLNDCYTDGYIGAMYDMHGQGVPIITPIDPEEVLRAVELDSKISEGLYTSLGHDVTALKIRIAGEVSRGIATALTYEEVARNLREQSRIPLNRARTIARTEGHRIQQASAHNAKIDAKQAGADVLKQWDATLDGDTRPEHRELDGQIKEVDEPFETESGLQAMYPGAFGKPEQDCNCRCASLQRARWALDVKELQVLKNRAEYFGLDKTKNLEEFKDKYIASLKKISKNKGLGAKTGGNGVPEHEEPVSIGKIDYNNKNAVKKELQEYEKDAIKENIETACVITKNGEIYRCYGTNDRVFPDFDLGDKLIGASVSHNHTIEETTYSFSGDDIELFIGYELEVLRGRDEIYTYEFTRDAISIDDYPDDWMNFENYQHADIIRQAKQHGIGYRRWKNE